MWRFAILTLGLLAALGATSAEAISLNKCVRVVRGQVGTETLINVCTVCYKAKVERQRPGGDGNVPTMRDYTLLPGAEQPLPFKGPGTTRIVAEFPCKG